jgi:CTP synthase
MLERMQNPRDEGVDIALVGKYVEYEDSYKSLKEALLHGGLAHNVKVNITGSRPKSFEKGPLERELEGFDGILVPGGFGKRGIEGMINAIRFAREQQGAVFRHLPRHADHGDRVRAQRVRPGARDSTEFDPGTPHRVIYKLRELKGRRRTGRHHAPGRLWPCVLKPRAASRAATATREISERHRHRYEFNRDSRVLTAHGLKITGETPDGTYVEICEIADHPWYLGCQFHPEFKSKPLEPHPLFSAFIGAAYVTGAHRLAAQKRRAARAPETRLEN